MGIPAATGPGASYASTGPGPDASAAGITGPQHRAVAVISPSENSFANAAPPNRPKSAGEDARYGDSRDAGRGYPSGSGRVRCLPPPFPPRGPPPFPPRGPPAVSTQGTPRRFHVLGYA